MASKTRGNSCSVVENLMAKVHQDLHQVSWYWFTSACTNPRHQRVSRRHARFTASRLLTPHRRHRGRGREATADFRGSRWRSTCMSRSGHVRHKRLIPARWPVIHTFAARSQTAWRQERPRVHKCRAPCEKKRRQGRVSYGASRRPSRAVICCETEFGFSLDELLSEKHML